MRPLEYAPQWVWAAYRMSYMLESIATAPDGLMGLCMFLDDLDELARGVSVASRVGAAVGGGGSVALIGAGTTEAWYSPSAGKGGAGNGVSSPRLVLAANGGDR